MLGQDNIDPMFLWGQVKREAVERTERISIHRGNRTGHEDTSRRLHLRKVVASSVKSVVELENNVKFMC